MRGDGAMTLFRYEAISAAGAKERGHLAATAATEVRHQLRALGLTVLEVAPMRAEASTRLEAGPFPRRLEASLRAAWAEHRRQRPARRRQRAEWLDGLATLLEAGLPALEAIQTLASARGGQRGRAVLTALGASLREGSSLGEAMRGFPSWFAPTEVAMVEAAVQGGRLAPVLRSIAARLERGQAVRHRLAAALVYPAVVGLVGMAAIVFLGVKTLPELVNILAAAGAEAPPLTLAVMAIGQFIVRHAFAIAAFVAILVPAPLAVAAMSSQHPALARVALSPRWMRRLALARVTAQLAEMLRAGVPMVEALRTLAPTAGLPALGRVLIDAARRLEAGEELAAALDDPRFVDAEFLRLLELGQSGGELDQLLDRAAERAERQASRLLERAATLLEPALILLLAAGVGLVVMAAILPILRLQEAI
jgi:general secretion pathway protein F